MKSLADRFWAKVDKRGPDECWPWLGATDGNGYGRIYSKGGNATASRASWELAHGEAPQGYHVCHSCDNPPCVNPSHLWLGTPQDNAIDRSAKGRDAQSRRTHCPKGHEYTPENTIIHTSRGGPERSCRECQRICGRERMRRIRAANISAGLTSKGKPRA